EGNARRSHRRDGSPSRWPHAGRARGPVRSGDRAGAYSPRRRAMTLPGLPRAIRAPDGADPYQLMRTLCEDGIADGLPVIPPTSARIGAMLRGHDAGRPLGMLPPLFRELTLEDVAVCAVLAGCG